MAGKIFTNNSLFKNYLLIITAADGVMPIFAKPPVTVVGAVAEIYFAPEVLFNKLVTTVVLLFTLFPNTCVLLTLRLATVGLFDNVFTTANVFKRATLLVAVLTKPLVPETTVRPPFDGLVRLSTLDVTTGALRLPTTGFNTPLRVPVSACA